MGHTFVQNMELLRHHMTVSQLKYQTSVVNRYAFDHSLFSINIVLRLLEALLRCINNRRDQLQYVCLELLND